MRPHRVPTSGLHALPAPGPLTVQRDSRRARGHWTAGPARSSVAGCVSRGGSAWPAEGPLPRPEAPSSSS
jgi:hypothetical protein